MIKSKFEKLYIVKLLLLPFICFGLGLLLLNVKLYYKPDAEVTYPVISLSIIGGCVLLYNLNSLYKVEANEKSIVLTNILSKKIKFIYYSEIVSYEKEFVNGYNSSEVGKLTPGYYYYKFILKDNNIIKMSPQYFTNNIELVEVINYHIKLLDNNASHNSL